MNKSLNTRVTLLDKIKSKNDNDSWDDYDRYYRSYIYALLRKMKINHHDCEDLAQLVLLKSWRNLPKFNYDKNRGKFRTWLAVMTRNITRDFINSKSVRNQNQEIEFIEDCFQDTDSEFEKKVEAEWQIYISDMAWGNIKDNFKSHIILAFELAMDGHPVKEIAQQLGLAESSVSVYKNRVSKALMKEIIRLDQFLC